MGHRVGLVKVPPNFSSSAERLVLVLICSLSIRRSGCQSERKRSANCKKGLSSGAAWEKATTLKVKAIGKGEALSASGAAKGHSREVSPHIGVSGPDQLQDSGRGQVANSVFAHT